MPIKGRLGPRSPPFFFFHSLLFTLRYKLHSLSAIPFRSSIPDRIVAWPRLRDEKDGDPGSEDHWIGAIGTLLQWKILESTIG